MTDAPTHGTAAHRLEQNEARSIGTAMRTTLAFVAIVLLLLWAGLSDAAPAAVSFVAGGG